MHSRESGEEALGKTTGLIYHMSSVPFVLTGDQI